MTDYNLEIEDLALAAARRSTLHFKLTNEQIKRALVEMIDDEQECWNLLDILTQNEDRHGNELSDEVTSTLHLQSRLKKLLSSLCTKQSLIDEVYRAVEAKIRQDHELLHENCCSGWTDDSNEHHCRIWQDELNFFTYTQH